MSEREDSSAIPLPLLAQTLARFVDAGARLTEVTAQEGGIAYYTSQVFPGAVPRHLDGPEASDCRHGGIPQAVVQGYAAGRSSDADGTDMRIYADPSYRLL